MVKISDDFAGQKCDLKTLAGKTIAVTNYKKETSTKHPGTSYYKMQFVIKQIDGSAKLCFATCGAQQIVQVLDQNPQVPFYRTIKVIGRSVFFAEDIASDEETLVGLIDKHQIDLNKL